MSRHKGAHDAMERVTIQEASRRLGRSEKTIRRWVHTGKLRPETIEGKFMFAVSELHDILEAEKPGPTVEERMTALEERVTDLQATLDEMKAKLDELSAGRTPSPIKTPPARILRETVPARQFAKDHGFTRDQMRGWIERGEIQATPQAYGSKTQYVLTKEQQQQALAFWQSLEGSE